MRFEQTWVPIDARIVGASAELIEAEPMFFNADIALAKQVLGRATLASWFLRSITNRLEGLPKSCIDGWLDGRWSLDSRSHMLMRGWYPAIPGWHHDDVDRGPNGQPDYDSELPDDRLMFAVVVDAIDRPTGSLTEFFQPGSTVSVPWPVPTDAPVYRYWDAHIEAECTAARVQLRSAQIVRFGPADFHRAMPATSSGWRWFARLTINPGPRPAAPKIRRQSQVYLPVTNSGW